MRLSIFAYQVSLIATETGKFSLHPCEGVDVEIVIEPSQMSHTDGKVWDQVTINGKWAGNRCGGRDAFTKLVCDANPTIVMD